MEIIQFILSLKLLLLLSHFLFLFFRLIRYIYIALHSTGMCMLKQCQALIRSHNQLIKFQRKRKNEIRKSSENLIQFILIVFIHFFLPILEIYPSVYVWYDYNVNKNLSITPRSVTISFILFFWVVTKLFFFILKNILLNEGNREFQKEKF